MNYPWQYVSPKDHYTLKQSTPLSDQDVQVLTAIYQPLIGNAAYALYMQLKAAIHSANSWTEPKPLSTLLAVLDMGIPELYQARIRLEGLGLLNVYKSNKETDHYLFELKPPLSAVQFFNDHMMRLILFEKVGERLFNEIRSQFEIDEPNKQDYTEITKSFLDVYHFNIQKHNQLNAIPIKPILNEKPDFSPGSQLNEQSEIDWKFFMDGLNRQFIDKSSINQEVRAVILSLHEIYGLNELDLQKYVLQATNIETSKVDQDKLAQIVQQAFHRQQANRVQLNDYVGETIQSEQTQSSNRRYRLKQEGFNDHEIEVILHAEEVKPGEYLSSIKSQKGGFVSSNEMWVIKELVEQSSLPSSVVNILINYILIGKNAPVLEKNLALKVANDWAQNQIASPEAALKKVKTLYAESRNNTQRKTQKKQPSRYKNQSNAKKETLPEWATEENKGEEIDLEKQAEFRKRLERIRNRNKGGEQ